MGRLRYVGAFFAGVVAALYAFMLAYGYAGSFTTKEMLLTAIAVAGAVGSIVTVYSQIESTETARKQELIRKIASSRAAIAAPLSTIAGIQKDLLKEIGEWLSDTNDAVFAGSIVTPAVALDDLKFLVSSIEFSESPASEDIAEFVAELQIQQSRLSRIRVARSSGESSSGRLRYDLKTYAIDALFLYARGSRLFYYVRRQDSKYASTTFSDVIRESCSLLVLDTGIEDDVSRNLSGRRGDWLARVFGEHS